MATFYVVGHSCRSIAQSLHRLGHQIVAYDDYQDQDLRDIAETHAIMDLERELDCAKIDRNRFFLLAGGMENRAELIQKLQAYFTILGPRVEQFRFLRDPSKLAQFVQRCNLRYPEIRTFHDPPPDDSQIWLSKPMKSGGGIGIRLWKFGSPVPDNAYLQKWIPGISISTTLLIHPSRTCKGDPERATWSEMQTTLGTSSTVRDGRSTSSTRSQTELIAVCRSLSPKEWDAPTDFMYRGSVFSGLETIEASKPPIHRNLVKECEAFGRLLAEETGYRGLLQLDWRFDESGELWLLEVNPRWAASFEVIELSLGANLAELQLGAFDWNEPGEAISEVDLPNAGQLHHRSAPSSCSRRCAGKAIVYAPKTVAVDDEQANLMYEYCRSQQTEMSESAFWLADLPLGGSLIEAGHPIVSVLGISKDPPGVMQQLLRGESFVLLTLGICAQTATRSTSL